MPKDWYYNCTVLGLDATNPAVCAVQLSQNDTLFYNPFGTMVWNTQSQPYWTLGVNNQKLNFASTTVRSTLYSLIVKTFLATSRVPLIVEMSYLADQYVANGMRVAPYTSATFMAEAAYYEKIVPGF